MKMKICRLAAIPAGGAIGVEIRAETGAVGLIVTASAQGPRAFLNRCPHTGVNLDWNPGVFMDADGRFLQCSTHGALFRPQDGACVAGPCTGQSLTSVPVLNEDGWVVLADAPAPGPG